MANSTTNQPTAIISKTQFSFEPQERSNNMMSINNFLVEEEEAQVVPSSLDHLSRADLCHMIYRLDYERRCLSEKLVALHLTVSASNVGIGGVGGGGRRRTKQTPSQLPLHKRIICRAKKKEACPNDDEEEKVAKKQKTTHDNDEPIMQQQHQEPTPLEMTAIHKRLAQNVLSNIKSTTHGGLLKPRTTSEEKDVSLATVMYIMQKWGDKLAHDSKRMIKWEFTCDDDIVKYLQCVKIISGVRHNGKGFLQVGNGSSFTQYAKFELMIVSYDKLTMVMKVQVSTRGCTDKGKCC